MSNMEQDHSIKNWLTSAVFEYACKNDYLPVIEKVLKDTKLSSNLSTNFASSSSQEPLDAVHLLIYMLRRLLSSVQTFATEGSLPWNSDSLPRIISFFEATFEQCEFISLKKFFSLVVQLKFLDLMHLLRLDVESPALMQRLYLYFPRWNSAQKSALVKKYFIYDPKILDKVEESCAQCRRLILKLVADPTYKSLYMSQQFSNDVEKMVTESGTILKEVITILSNSAGPTAIEKGLTEEQMSSQYDNFGYQLLLDYVQPEASPEALLHFLNEMESFSAPPSGGFSCILPFDTMSECSEDPMDPECDESGTESGSEESSEEKDKTKPDEKDI